MEKLAAKLRPGRVRLGWAVTACAQPGEDVDAGGGGAAEPVAAVVTVAVAGGSSVSSAAVERVVAVRARKHVVFAAPPKLLAGSVAFAPPLPASRAAESAVL